MLKDLPNNEVTNIGIAVVLEEESPGGKSWGVYLINMKDQDLHQVLVSSKGYGLQKTEKINTSILRHALGELEAGDFKLIEPLMEELFFLSNEYLLSFYLDGVLYDKKYVFVPESIAESNFIRVPIINKPGVMII